MARGLLRMTGRDDVVRPMPPPRSRSRRSWPVGNPVWARCQGEMTASIPYTVQKPKPWAWPSVDHVEESESTH